MGRRSCLFLKLMRFSAATQDGGEKKKNYLLCYNCVGQPSTSLTRTREKKIPASQRCPPPPRRRAMMAEPRSPLRCLVFFSCRFYDGWPMKSFARPPKSFVLSARPVIKRNELLRNVLIAPLMPWHPPTGQGASGGNSIPSGWALHIFSRICVGTTYNAVRKVHNAKIPCSSFRIAGLAQTSIPFNELGRRI